MSTTISIALCTYNGERYLEAQLASLAGQSRQPDELVIVDDCSNDTTRQISAAFAAHAPFPVRLYENQENLGSTRNFERAIGLCSGDLIALCDQDDVWYAHKLSRIETVMQAQPQAALAFSDADVVDAQAQPLGYRLWQTSRFSVLEQQQITQGKALAVLVRRNVITGSAMVFRSCYKDLLLPISPLWVHDGWIALLLACQYDITLIAEPLIQYRQHGQNQIGAVRKPWYKRRASRVDYLVRRDKYQAVRQRLLERAHPSARLTSALTQVEAKAAHLEARDHLNRALLMRFPIALAELFSGHYHRYSGGTASFLRDLWRTP